MSQTMVFEAFTMVLETKPMGLETNAMASKPETIFGLTATMVYLIKRIGWFSKIMVAGIEPMIGVNIIMVPTSETMGTAAQKRVPTA